MPRIRTLKPEALQHRKVGRLSDRAFRLWIALITQADDEGRLAWDAAQFRALVWGFHDRMKLDQVLQALEEIRTPGLCRLYRVGGQLYLDLPSWRDHQSIDRPTRSKIPPYQEECAVSSNPRRGLIEDSSRTREGSEGSEGTCTPMSDRTAGQATATGSAPRGPKASGPSRVAACESFEQFWAEWPPSRRVGKADALKAWRALNPTEELRTAILAALRHQKQLSAWQREDGRYIPHPHRWLLKRRWEDAAESQVDPDPYAKFPRVSEETT